MGIKKFSPEKNTGAGHPYPTPTAPVFPYKFRWNRDGRKGQNCRQISRQDQHACIEFENDGTRMVVTLSAIIRRKEFRDSIKSGNHGNVVTNSVRKGGRGKSPEPLAGESAALPARVSIESGTAVR